MRSYIFGHNPLRNKIKVLKPQFYDMPEITNIIILCIKNKIWIDLKEIITSSNIYFTIETMMAGQIRNRPWINNTQETDFLSNHEKRECPERSLIIYNFLYLANNFLYWYIFYHFKSRWEWSQFFRS